MDDIPHAHCKADTVVGNHICSIKCNRLYFNGFTDWCIRFHIYVPVSGLRVGLQDGTFFNFKQIANHYLFSTADRSTDIAFNINSSVDPFVQVILFIDTCRQRHQG